MWHKLKNPLVLGLALGVLLTSCMLGLYRSASAQQQRGNPLPFSNSVEQRENMVRELREIKALIREQNALLRTIASKNDPPAATTTNDPRRAPIR